MNSIALRIVLNKYATHPQFLGNELQDLNQRGAVDDSVLHLAAGQGCIEDMQVLINEGADLNMLGDMGNTPLHCAALMGQAPAAALLLKQGARVDVCNEFGQTPLEIAEIGGKTSVIKGYAEKGPPIAPVMR